MGWYKWLRFDCSGFTHTIYKSHGITIPRDSGPQSRNGVAVDKEHLQKGDLIFLHMIKGKAVFITLGCTLVTEI